MIKRWCLWLLALSISIALVAPPAFSQGRARVLSNVTGEVIAVDPRRGTVTIKTLPKRGAKQEELKLTAEKSSLKSALEKLRVGDTIIVGYSKEGELVLFQHQGRAYH